MNSLYEFSSNFYFWKVLLSTCLVWLHFILVERSSEARGEWESGFHKEIEPWRDVVANRALSYNPFCPGYWPILCPHHPYASTIALSPLGPFWFLAIDGSAKDLLLSPFLFLFCPDFTPLPFLPFYPFPSLFIWPLFFFFWPFFDSNFQINNFFI